MRLRISKIYWVHPSLRSSIPCYLWSTKNAIFKREKCQWHHQQWCNECRWSSRIWWTPLFSAEAEKEACWYTKTLWSRIQKKTAKIAIDLFPTSPGLSEWASEQTSECSRAHEQSEQLEQANKYAVQANEQMYEWVAQDSHLDSWLFWTIVQGARGV